MKDFQAWWRNVPPQQKPIWTILCYVVLFAVSIDLGRTLYGVFH
jgi:hypothetical protein